MSGMLRRHYARGGEHHTVVLDHKQGILRVRIDREDAEHAHLIDARLLCALTSGAEIWLSPGGRAVVVRHGDRIHVAFRGRTYVLDVISARPGGDVPAAAVDIEDFVASPMTGIVFKVNVAAGATVAAGETLCVVEAMKMEFAIEAPRDVVIDAVSCVAGDRVDIGDVLVTFQPSE